MAERRTDAELVEAAREGREEAFGELMGRYRDAVFGVAFHRLGNFEEARDVVQEAFVKAYLGLGGLRDPSAFGPWLYRIADGTAVDAARKPRREEPLSGAEVAPDRSHEAEAAREVREMIARLSEPARLAVVLHYVNGYSHAEVARFLGTTPEAVKMRLSRARGKLREEMAEMAGERIRRAARPAKPQAFEYIARAADGKVISGRAEATSERELVRGLRVKGYFVQKVTEAAAPAHEGPGTFIAAVGAGPAPERKGRTYEFEATTADGKAVTGVMQASSKAELRRRLKERGYTVRKVERGRPLEKVIADEREEPIRRIVGVILQQAVKDKATAIRAELCPPPAKEGEEQARPSELQATPGPRAGIAGESVQMRAAMSVWYKVRGKWHQVMGLPEYMWAPLRARIVEMAGEAGEIRFQAEGTEHTARVEVGEREIRMKIGGRD